MEPNSVLNLLMDKSVEDDIHIKDIEKRQEEIFEKYKEALSSLDVRIEKLEFNEINKLETKLFNLKEKTKLIEIQNEPTIIKFINNFNDNLSEYIKTVKKDFNKRSFVLGATAMHIFLTIGYILTEVISF